MMILRGVGDLVHKSLEVNMHIQHAITKVKKMQACNAKGFQYKSRGILLQLYRALVDPHLEHCVRHVSLPKAR